MAPQQSKPLISCICITNRRPALLLKAIASYSEQNYGNLELIVSFPKDDLESESLINIILYHYPLRIVQLPRTASISVGQARNEAISLCQGDYVCMWDDDDIYYPTRINDQYEALIVNDQPSAGSILTRIILYEATARKAFLSFPSYWACSLLAKRDLWQKYPCDDRDEYEYLTLIDYLKSTHQLLLKDLSPSLYAFVYHGTNTMKYSTFLSLIDKSEVLPSSVAEDIEAYLKLKIELPEIPGKDFGTDGH